MKDAELVQLHPWANHPMVRPHAGSFTKEQWQNIKDSGLPRILPEIDPIIITSFFNACKMLAPQTNLSIEVVKAMVDSLKTCPLQLQKVLAWLGDALSARLEREITSSAMMDDLVHLLSAEETRIRFEQPLVSQNPKLNGKYLRDLYRLGIIDVKEFIDIIQVSNQLPQRAFPAWISNHVEIRTLANEFTDEQLRLLSNLLSQDIRKDRELSCSFLRVILAETSNDQQKVKECPLDSFEVIVRSSQNTFIDVATQKYALFDEEFMSDASRAISYLGLAQNTPLVHTLIRRHVAKYKDMPIPPHEENEALHCALRNAAYAGNYWSLLSFTLLTKTLNLPGGQSGRTALHRAVECVNRTGDRLCFDLLANHAEIDFSIKDTEGKTPLDLWDFRKHPDETLLNKLMQLKNKKNSPIQARRSPLIANSVFPPEPANASELEDKEQKPQFNC